MLVLSKPVWSPLVQAPPQAHRASLEVPVVVAAPERWHDALHGKTETCIVIDDERLTWRGGILMRRVISVELYRIQKVEARMRW
jgi:hypothetical protein